MVAGEKIQRVASDEPGAGEEQFVAPPSADLPRLRRRLRFLITALLLTALLSVNGLFIDKSVRPDPFTPNPQFLDWLTKWQPHPALTKMPVVPVGTRAHFVFRPQDTSWISGPNLPDVSATPASAAGLTPKSRVAEQFRLVGAAQAQKAESPTQQQLPSQSQQQELAPKPADRRTRDSRGPPDCGWSI